MTSVVLCHGFNVSDGGKDTTDSLRGLTEACGYTVLEADYGEFCLFVVLNNFYISLQIWESWISADVRRVKELLLFYLSTRHRAINRGRIHSGRKW